MKPIVLLFLLLPIAVAAQEIAFIDRNLKTVVVVAETGTTRTAVSGAFPIYTADLDAVIHLTETLGHAINAGTRLEPETHLLQAGHSHYAVTVQRNGVVPLYLIVLNTRCGNVESTLEVVRSGRGRLAAQRLLQLADYLKNNRHLAKQ